MDFNTFFADAAKFFRVRICAGNQDIDVLNLCACETVCFADFAAVSDNDDLAGSTILPLTMVSWRLEVVAPFSAVMPLTPRMLKFA